MENIGTSFGGGMINGFLLMLPMLMGLMLFKHIVNDLLDTNNKKKNYKKSKYQKNYTNQKYYRSNEEYLSVTEIANHFKIEPKHLNIILSKMNWCYKSNKWWIATDLGKIMGAKEFYDKNRRQKYIKWESSIKEDEELIRKINDFRVSNNF